MQAPRFGMPVRSGAPCRLIYRCRQQRTPNAVAVNRGGREKVERVGAAAGDPQKWGSAGGYTI